MGKVVMNMGEIRKMEKRLLRGLSRIVDEYVLDITRTMLRGQGPSAPGEPPIRRSGRMLRHIHSKIERDGDVARGMVMIHGPEEEDVWKQVLALEYGRRGREARTARPMWEPTWHENLQKYQSLFDQEVSG